MTDRVPTIGGAPGTAITAVAPVSSNGLNAQQVGNLVRYWVYYDTQIASLNRQIRKLREDKQMTESQIITSFQATRMPNPVIQIAGGRLVVGQERRTEPLTFKMLQTMLKQYFSQKVGARDETDAILSFIKERRDVTLSPSLKRITTPTTPASQQPQG